MAPPRALRILVVATKPPWPVVDGGRLLLHSTLAGLAARGHRVHLVAPASPGGLAGGETDSALGPGCTATLVPVRPRGLFTSLLRGHATGRPMSIDRHRHPAVRREAARLLAAESWDVVHVEQLQALTQVEGPALGAVPVLLRAQNVESELWAGMGSARGLGALAQLEAVRLARWEGAAVARSAATAALTARDAARLRELAGGRGRVSVLRAPFAPRLPSADATLPGRPSLVLFGSEGWAPNRDAVAHFAREVWPAVRQALPEARLHVFGNWVPAVGAEAVVRHPAPSDSRTAFAPGSVLLVPLRVASGVRMRILEAWARGLPVVASPSAAAGLDVADGAEVLLARDGAETVAALRRLEAEPGLAARLTEAGRAVLTTRHDPATLAAELEALYVALSTGPLSTGAPTTGARVAAR